MKHQSRYLILVVLFAVFANGARAQVSDANPVANLFEEQLGYFPQEKIYAQTDRNLYMSGDSIWFRVHLVEAVLFQQANASRYVYMELIDSEDKIAKRVKIRPDSTGCFYGHIPITEDLVEGNYSLRAYTRFMQNQGEDYFFRKPVYIAAPTRERPQNEKTDRPREKTFDVAFLPEGGHAPFSTDVTMAFKAINNEGLSEEIKGEVFDDLGQSRTTFESIHLGMGSFRMYYEPDRSYHAVCTNSAGVSKRFDLPAATAGAVALKAMWMNDRFRITLTKSPEGQLPAGTCLVAHTRGVVIYEQPWNETSGAIAFARDFFPAGITHFLLIDGQRNILSERLVFSYQESALAGAVIVPDKNSYVSREKVTLKIGLIDGNQAPLAGNFSLAVTDTQAAAVDSTSNIVSTLLLTSDLKGHIESPMSYLKKDDRGMAQALDILMMTQGWRRYDIPNVLKGEIKKELQYPVELSEEVAGRAQGVFSNLKDGGLSLIAFKDSLIIGTALAAPDEKGKFVFGELEYPEGTNYIVQALTKRGSQNVFLTLDEPKPFPPLTIPVRSADRSGRLDTINTHIANMIEKYIKESGGRLFTLDEIVIRAKPLPKTDSPFYDSNSSRVLTAEYAEEMRYRDIFQLIRDLPGITVIGDGAEIRYRDSTPAIVLDGSLEENFDWDRIDISDVKDVFLARESPFFGNAIVISTKRGVVSRNVKNRNIEGAKAVGYQPPAEFYSPRYATQAAKNSTIPDMRTTIYWNPNVQVDETGLAEVSFYAADPVTQYGVVIEGVSKGGHIIHSQKKDISIN